MGDTAACGSEHCAGCYEVEPGVRIHPPKTSAMFLKLRDYWAKRGLAKEEKERAERCASKPRRTKGGR